MLFKKSSVNFAPELREKHEEERAKIQVKAATKRTKYFKNSFKLHQVRTALDTSLKSRINFKEIIRR